MKANMMIGVKGEYKLIRRKAITDDFGNRVPGPIVAESEFGRNVMTTRFFDDALTVAPLGIRACVVGENNTPPSETDTTLVDFQAQTTTLQAFSVEFNTTVSPRYARKIYTYRFGEGVAAGNIAEVGLVPSSYSMAVNASAPIISRALVKDAGGLPIVMTVLSDEYLDVIFRMTWYVPEDVTGSVNIAVRGVSTPFNYTIRGIGLAEITQRAWHTGQIGCCSNGLVGSGNDFDPGASAHNTLQAYTADPSGYIAVSSNRVSSVTPQPFAPGSKNRTFKFTFGPTQANIAVQSFFFKNYHESGYSTAIGAYQILLDAPLPTKLNTEQLAFYVNIALANAP